MIDSVRVGAGRRPLDTPYLILSIQHDGSVKDLIAHLAEPKQRELLENALHFAEDFAEAKDVRAFLQNHRAKTALTVTSYPRHSLAVVHTALANRERLVRLQNGSAVRQLGHTASTGKPDVRYLERTQGNILKGYSTEYVHGAYALMQVHEPDAARDWIRQLADRITTAESKPTEDDDTQPRLQPCRPGGPRRRQVPVEVVLQGVRRRNAEARRRAPRRRRLQRTRSLDPRSDPPGAVNPRFTRTRPQHSWTPNWRRSSTPQPRGSVTSTSSGGGSSSTT